MARVMAAAVSGIGDRVYQNMVRTVGIVYVLKSLVVTSSPSINGPRRITTHSKQ